MDENINDDNDDKNTDDLNTNTDDSNFHDDSYINTSTNNEQKLTFEMPMIPQMYSNPNIMLTLNTNTQTKMIILTTQMYWVVMIHCMNQKMNLRLHNNKTMKRNVLQIPTMNKHLLTATLQTPSKI